MRELLLFLSRQRWLRTWMETSPLARKLSSRFVAGDTLSDSLAVSQRINGQGIHVTMDRLGENVGSVDEAAGSRDEYIEALEAIAQRRIEGNVSIKLTQFGMDLSEQACFDNAAALVARAAELNNFVRVDMESSAYVDRTLRLVTALHSRYGCVGTVIQAYLYRSEKDIDALCRRGIRVRLCKGAYLEPASVAFARKADVDRNYVRLMMLLFDRGVYPAIATHDERMIEETRNFARERKMAKTRFEFQMLYGIRRDLQARLISEGYRLRLYVPFGKAWYPYFMRRLAERPANLVFLARNLLRR